MSGLVGSNGGMVPAGTTSTVVSGSPHWASNALRSFWMVGEPNESTITIVRPAPVIPLAYNGFRLYATRYCTGE